MQASTQISTLIQQIEHAQQQNDLALANQLAQSGIAAHPNEAKFYFLSAFSGSRLGKTEQAYQHQTKAIALDPNNAIYHFNAAIYASQHNDRGLELRAMLHYRRALAIEPNYADALWNYGEHLRLEGHIQMAIDCFERLLKMNVLYPKIYNRLAASYECLDQDDKVDEIYNTHIAPDSSDVIGAWGHATSQLRREIFDEGLTFYNKRFDCSWLNNAYYYPFKLPFWDGVMKPNMTLLIHGEQGLGDEMMFASTMNELLVQAKAVNSQVIIACKPPLARLFQTSFPDALDVLVHQYDNPADISRFKISAHLPMGNLLARHRKCLADFTAHHEPYLRADQKRAAYYNEQIIKLGRESVDGKRRFRVGLMWGTIAVETGHQRFLLSASRRSIPAGLFGAFEDLVNEVEFVSLQNHEAGAEAALVPQLNIVDFSLDQADFYDTAALISNLDLVITIDTSVFHLAGAMGTETWVALIKEPEWRFGRKERMHSYWYGNTRYFRQTSKNQWAPVIDQLHQALQERLGQRT